MKKILIIVFVAVSLVLTGCVALTTTLETTASTAMPTTVSTTAEPSLSKAELIERFEYYEVRFQELYESEEAAAAPRRKTSTVQSLVVVDIPRGDLPEEPDWDDPEIQPDPEFFEASILVLQEIHDALVACVTLVENQLNGVEQADTGFLIRIESEEPFLEVEYYVYEHGTDFNPNLVSVSYSMVRFDLLGDLLSFEQVRESRVDYGSWEEHKRYYDRFVENGDFTNAYVDMLDETQSHYQHFEADTEEVFLWTSGPEGAWMNVTDNARDLFASVGFDASDAVTSVLLVYGGRHDALLYSQADGSASIRWNLYDVAGWNIARVDDYGAERILLDDVVLLEDFEIEIVTDYYGPCHARLTVEVGLVTAGLLDLSDYGLSFTTVAYDTLMADLAAATDGAAAIRTTHGFSGVPETDREILLALFPCFADETIVAELWD